MRTTERSFSENDINGASIQLRLEEPEILNNLLSNDTKQHLIKRKGGSHVTLQLLPPLSLEQAVIVAKKLNSPHQILNTPERLVVSNLGISWNDKNGMVSGAIKDVETLVKIHEGLTSDLSEFTEGVRWQFDPHIALWVIHQRACCASRTREAWDTMVSEEWNDFTDRYGELNFNSIKIAFQGRVNRKRKDIEEYLKELGRSV